MISRPLVAAGACVLVLAWLVPWHIVGAGHFGSHMIVHVAVVAVAAPLLALGIAGTRLDPVRLAPRWFPPVLLSVVELLAVWGWHAPLLHDAARGSAPAYAIEQLCFLASGLAVWIASFGGDGRPNRRAAGLVALLLTSMHMTLLGALLALAPRPLYVHVDLGDQHAGGAIMLLVGGASYLAGGLALALGLLRDRRRAA